MAKTKVSEVGTEMFTVRSSVIRHVNKQVSGADSSVVFGEAITNPAYREAAHDEYLGILLLSAMVDKQLSAPFNMVVAVAHTLTHQVQVGNQTGTPAIMDRDNQFLHAYAQREQSFAAGGGYRMSEFYPMPLQKLHPEDVIVTPEFTIVHDFGVNNANYQSKPIEVELLYQIVEVPNIVFTRMLMDQTRTS